MKARIFIPAVERIHAETPVYWTLLDARNNILRQDSTTLADIPRAEEIEAILPASRVLFARLKLPRVNATTIRELLPYAVEDRLLGDPAQIHAVAGRRETGGETTVAVVDRDWLAGMLDALRRAGLRPAHAWSESSLLPEGREWHVVWGPERGLLVDDRGVSVAFDRTGGELPLAIRLAMDEAASRSERPARIALHPERGAPLPDVSRWSSEAGVAFVEAPAWESLHGADVGRQAIDLLAGEFAPRASRLSTSAVPRAAVILAIVIAGLQLAFLGLDTWRLERERQTLEARREAIFRDAFPEARTVVDPDLQMSRNLADLRRTRGLASDDDFLAQLTRAAREGAPVRAVEYANGRLQVKR
jgi:general secretion pathway protein L